MSMTSDLLDRLKRHYIKPSQPFPGGIFIPECGLNDGTTTQSRCDALYVGFTSTSGRLLVGHEVKVSRQDWRHELDQPGKADRWADQCHAWYVVAPSVVVVPPQELPAGWGLMVPNARTATRMDVKVKATVHADRTPSWLITRSIMARLDTLQVQALAQHRQDVRDEVRAEHEKRQAANPERRLTDQEQSRMAALDQLETALGVTVQTWLSGHDAEAVRARTLGHALALSDALTGLPSPYDLTHSIRTTEAILERLRLIASVTGELRDLGKAAS